MAPRNRPQLIHVPDHIYNAIVKAETEFRAVPFSVRVWADLGFENVFVPETRICFTPIYDSLESSGA